jgi:hypothetical protein
MNCRLCQENLDAYREASLPVDMMSQLEEHLAECAECQYILREESLLYGLIAGEKNSPSSGVSVQVVMNAVSSGRIELPVSQRGYMSIVRPTLIAASLAAALFAGILIGDLYALPGNNPGKPDELKMMNDSYIESITELSNE